MMKGKVSFIFLFFISINLISQQDAQFSHNKFNIMGFNPGYAGMRNAICGTLIARQQWVGFKDDDQRVHPKTYSLNLDAPVDVLRGGVSLGFLQDELGFEKNTGVKIGYAYHTPVWFGNMGIGMQVGFIDKVIDFSKFDPINDDPILSGGSDESAMLIDFAFGVFYKEPDWWAGLSATQMFENDREIADNAMYELKRHTYLTGGFDFPIPNHPKFLISPSSLIKTDFNSLQFDINTMINYDDRFWGGLSYRFKDAIVVFLGLNINEISIGYSYDITTSLIGRQRRSYGSHEIMIKYCFDLEIERLPRPHRTTRYL